VLGYVLAPLLLIMDMKLSTENGRMHKILNLPLYVPPKKKNFDAINVDIVSDTGNPVPFVYDKSVAVLVGCVE